MKRVLCIFSSMNSGGAETFLMKVFRKLDRSKYQMDFCLNTREECYYNKEIRELGGKIFYVPPKSADVKEFKKQLAALVRNENYKYVLRIAANAAGFMDLKIAKKAGAEICSARSSNSSDGNGIAVKVVHLLGRMMYGKYADVKFAPSDLAAIHTFGEKAYKNGDVTILNNAVDLDVFRYSADDRLNIRAEFGIDPGATVIGHVGRFATQKNHTFLLKVFAEIRKKNPDTVLLLVGGGELEDAIRREIGELGLSENVIFAGIRSDIPKILSAMDVFVMPSFYEGMPNTVIEAQATGLPCVIADTITREANITGLVEYLPLENPENWAEKALGAIAEERKDTKEAFIANRYDIQSTVDNFVKLVFGE